MREVFIRERGEGRGGEGGFSGAITLKSNVPGLSAGSKGGFWFACLK